MLSHALYRWGRFAARRPLAMIGSWLVVSVLVIGASGAFGQDLEDSFEVPGLDSQEAADLLTAARSDQVGLTAQVVLTPRDERATFFDAPDARAALAKVQAAVAGLPKVLDTTDPAGAAAAGPEAAAASGAISPDGRVALIRVQYPVLEDLNTDDLENLKELGAGAGAGSPLRIEMGGDLFFAFEEAATGIGELIGLVAAVVILLLAFGSLIAMGLPIGMAVFGLALGISSMSLITYLIDIPALGAFAWHHDRPRRGHRLRPVHRRPAPRVPRPRDDRRGVGRPRRRHRRPGRGLRRRHGGHRDPRPGRRRRPVHDRRRHGHLGHRADHGGRLDHAAARVPWSCRAPDQPPRPAAQPGARWRHGGVRVAALG